MVTPHDSAAPETDAGDSRAQPPRSPIALYDGAIPTPWGSPASGNSGGLPWGGIAGWALVLNMAWELVQCPLLYDMVDRGFGNGLLMGFVILGDLLIVLGVTGVAVLLVGRQRVAPPKLAGGAALLVTGFVVAVGLEWAAQALGLWGYSELMPTLEVGGRSVGLSPVVQVAVLPTLCVRLAGRAS